MSESLSGSGQKPFLGGLGRGQGQPSPRIVFAFLRGLAWGGAGVFLTLSGVRKRCVPLLPCLPAQRTRVLSLRAGREGSTFHSSPCLHAPEFPWNCSALTVDTLRGQRHAVNLVEQLSKIWSVIFEEGTLLYLFLDHRMSIFLTAREQPTLK